MTDIINVYSLGCSCGVSGLVSLKETIECPNCHKPMSPMISLKGWNKKTLIEMLEKKGYTQERIDEFFENGV